ncbi:hypothetical protein TNCV_4413301 [Trichonephila clavipes]|nr:hypothetical protein TNCV_4413301 [Trichonephila clavipes]
MRTTPELRSPTWHVSIWLHKVLHTMKALTACLTSALLPKRFQARFFFKAGRRKKSLGERSGLCSRWCRHSLTRVAVWFCVAVAVVSHRHPTTERQI